MSKPLKNQAQRAKCIGGEIARDSMPWPFARSQLVKRNPSFKVTAKSTRGWDFTAHCAAHFRTGNSYFGTKARTYVKVTFAETLHIPAGTLILPCSSGQGEAVQIYEITRILAA